MDSLTWFILEMQVPGLMKLRYIGQTTVGSAAIFSLFLGAGSLIHCGKSYWVSFLNIINNKSLVDFDNFLMPMCTFLLLISITTGAFFLVLVLVSQVLMGWGLESKTTNLPTLLSVLYCLIEVPWWSAWWSTLGNLAKLSKTAPNWWF